MFAVFRDLIRYNIEFAIGVVLVGVVTVFASASFFSPVDPSLIYLTIPDQPPSWQYWFGTNSRGQDMFWQLSAAFKNSLTFGITVAVLSRIISISVGLTAGYVGGWVDRALMFINDIFVSMPIFPILVLFYFVLRSHMDSMTLALIMACFGWPFDARLIRSVALGLKHREFTRHAVFAGMSTPKVLLEEHLPYVMPIVFATFMNNMLWSIGLEVTLAVLGFTNINQPTIGTVLYWANSHSAMVVGVWWWIVIPVILIVITFLGLFLLAVSMNEYIDPRSRLRRMGA
ncbi:ABC transporter permease [Devosia sp. J2-20]|jgi:peptide/nickel transport system permease protein|uniref:ABC transporter permease n=1 Tax=Devosia litorisediminis TaxID=2829817 RepID=A0A942I5J5_9HYPH|nr:MULTISPECIES: ABC transporter permease [Devosia]MBS3849006.1 ABC transporter permease [Devosia litorisediminis]MCZ4344993.1 ABC transporter permease [Devosia neptuniae]WDQ97921.1 ABC transporter permease [Devosia sp. J2-20]|tara:strand:+ start:8900 stop:9757 length:858 start_codon:yes stop_codon:yes gene_type:complete